jgi:flavin reductase (DIM6/NTAB) family NADH-FMN oxidoreductase RutF
MRIDPAGQTGPDLYRLLISAIVPRPIAWVGSRSAAGVDNLAPFSFFMGVSSAPLSLAISVARGRGGALKDTARNILETGVFTVSTVSFADRLAMNDSAVPHPPEVSEFEVAQIPARPGERVAAPAPASAGVCFECVLRHSHDLGGAHLIVGEVVLAHVCDELVGRSPDGAVVVELSGLDPIARLGGPDYTRVTEVFSLPAPRR